MIYLKNKQEYIDRYDIKTIEFCLDWYQSIFDDFKKHRNDKEFKKYTYEEFEFEINKVASYSMNVHKGERYRNKYKTIDEWIERDRKLQEKYDNAPIPTNIKCQHCGGDMKMTLKELSDSHTDKPYMWFMFGCTKCNRRRAVLEDGSDWIYEKPKCPKCKSELKNDIKFNRKDDITTYIDTCPKCGYKNKHVSDHKKFKLECEVREKKEKELLEKYREDYCSDKVGKSIMETVDAMKFACEVMDAEIKKYDDPAQDFVAKVDVLDVNKFEKFSEPILKKNGYLKFSLGKPEIDRSIIVPFSLQDTNPVSKNIDKTKELEKILKENLEKTNWRLVSNSLSNRLGFVSGRFRAYESKEELLELFGNKKENKEVKLDPEKLAKYAGNGWVDIGRWQGQYIGMENVRKRRLAQEPNGFLLDVSDKTYTCTICREQSLSGETWWLPDALWCANCKKNIDEGIIPKLFDHEDDHDKTWFTKFDIEYNYDLKWNQIKRLEKKGLLHSRNLINLERQNYCSIYLLKENEEFFKTHPKVKKIYPKSTVKESDGEEITL